MSEATSARERAVRAAERAFEMHADVPDVLYLYAPDDDCMSYQDQLDPGPTKRRTAKHRAKALARSREILAKIIEAAILADREERTAGRSMKMPRPYTPPKPKPLYPMPLAWPESTNPSAASASSTSSRPVSTSKAPRRTAGSRSKARGI